MAQIEQKLMYFAVFRLKWPVFGQEWKWPLRMIEGQILISNGASWFTGGAILAAIYLGQWDVNPRSLDIHTKRSVMVHSDKWFVIVLFCFCRAPVGSWRTRAVLHGLRWRRRNPERIWAWGLPHESSVQCLKGWLDFGIINQLSGFNH